MGLYRAGCLGWLRAAVAVGLLGLLVPCRAGQAQAPSPEKGKGKEAAAGPARDVRSRSFLLHTDLTDREAGDLVVELEAMLRHVSTYWGRPTQGTIECYVVRDFDHFSLDAMDRGASGASRRPEGRP